MSYYFSVLKDKPIAFWMMDEIGTTATDYSGYENHATYSFTVDDSRLPLVSGTRIGVRVDSGKSIVYPPLPIWGNNQNSFPFSIEMWFYDYGSTEEVVLFAPFDSDGLLIGSGIFLNNGKITVSVGDGTGLAEPEYQIELDHQIVEGDRAHHLVVDYSVTGLSLRLDGAEYTVTEEQTLFQNKWEHELSGFMTITNDSEGVMVDCVSIYQRPLSQDSVIMHYAEGTKTIGIGNIMSRFPGVSVPINGDGIENSMDWFMPGPSGWDFYDQGGTVVDDMVLGLKEIQPLFINDGTPAVFTTELELQADQYLTLEGFNEHTNEQEGGISLAVYLEGMAHNNAGEYTFIRLINDSDYLEIMHNSSQDIVLRHTYVDEDGIEVIVDSAAGPATYDAWSEVYLVWSEGTYTLYLNDFSTYVQYIDGENKVFYLGTVVSANLGGTANGALLESGIKQFNIWDYVPTEHSTLAEVVDATTGYTARLTDSLSISQTASAVFEVDVSGLLEVDEVRINFGPRSPKILVEQSLDNDTYSAIESNHLINGFQNGDSLSELTDSLYYRVTLTTEDSYFDPTELYYMRLTADEVSDNYALESGYTLSPRISFTSGDEDLDLLKKYRHNGLSLGVDGFAELSPQAYDQDDTFDERPAISDTPARVRGISFLIKQNEVDGTNVYLVSKHDPTYIVENDTGLLWSGFDSLYINGQASSTGASLPVDEWAHVFIGLDEGSGVHRENLVYNPRLGSSDAGWNALSEGAAERSTEEIPISGDYSYKMTAGASVTTEFGFYLDEGLSGIPVSENGSYWATAYLSAQTEGDQRTANIRVTFYDSMGDPISQESSASFDIGESWSPFSVHATSPAGAQYASISCRIYDAEENEVYYASGVILENSESLYPYFDGDFEDASWNVTEDNSTSLSPVGVLITEASPLLLGNEVSSGISASYKHLCLYEEVFTEDMIEENFNSFIGRNYIAISDGGVSYDYPFGYLPLVPGGEEDVPLITDLDPLAVATKWSISSSE